MARSGRSSSSKRRSKGKRRGGSSGPRLRIDAAVARRLGLGAGVLAVLGALVWTVGAGIPRMQSAVAASTAEPDPLTVEFVDAPAWSEGTLQEWLAGYVRAEVADDIFDRTGLIIARETLLELGCFASVDQVRRVSANRVEVRATFLQPYAIVEHPAGTRMIDSYGYVLPAAYEPNDAVHFVTIRGVRAAPPARPGTIWPGGDLSAGLRLLRELEGKVWLHQLEAIEVRDTPRRTTIHLITDRDRRILWQSAPGEESGGEVSVAEKLRRLEHLFTEYGRIDGDQDQPIDLTDPVGIFLRPNTP